MIKHMREPVNGLMHYFAALAALVGLVALVVMSWDDPQKQRSLLVYGASLTLMMMASASYHLIQGSPRRIAFLRKIDHSAIFILIAGTYTPICYNLLEGFWQWGILAIVWSLALVGIVSKVFFINTPRWFTITVYLGMGWLGVLAVKEMLAALPLGAMIWLLAGGVTYSLGALVYATKKLDFKPGVFGFHEVWHIFVVLGALCHFVVVAVYVA